MRRVDLVAVARTWFGWLIPLSLVTQLWAGSQFSRGQGGGLKELVGWVVLFGAVVLAMVAERHMHASGPDIGWAAERGAFVGFLVGGAIALVWFSSKGGPTPGDWFVGPAAAAAGAAVALYVWHPARRR